MGRELLGIWRQFETIGWENTWWCMTAIGCVSRAVFGVLKQIQWVSKSVLKYVQRGWGIEAKWCLADQRDCRRDGWQDKWGHYEREEGERVAWGLVAEHVGKYLWKNSNHNFLILFYRI